MNDDTEQSAYAAAGVDIDAAEKAVFLMQQHVKKTHQYAFGKIITDSRAFAALVKMPNGNVFAYSTDGTGTKMKFAEILKKFDTIGIDLVGMSANDILATGVYPGIFLDYIATAKLFPEITAEIVKGIADGCCEAEMALVGGETAEMPGVYGIGEYDIVGFAHGVAMTSDELLIHTTLEIGMPVYGLPSSGIHANGSSLLRKIFCIGEDKERARKVLDVYYSELGGTLGEELIKPTKIYVKDVARLRKKHNIIAAAHITGGGLVDNPARILPNDLSMNISINKWFWPRIFNLVQNKGKVSTKDMLKTFNCGIGFIVVSPDEICDDSVIRIGEIVPGDGTVIFE